MGKQEQEQATYINRSWARIKTTGLKRDNSELRMYL